MANKTIKTLNANSYNGTFEAELTGATVVGSFNTDGGKNLTGINGDVKEGNATIGNFNGWWNGEKMVYNFNGIEDIEKLVLVASSAASALEAVREELVQ